MCLRNEQTLTMMLREFRQDMESRTQRKIGELERQRRVLELRWQIAQLKAELDSIVLSLMLAQRPHQNKVKRKPCPKALANN